MATLPIQTIESGNNVPVFGRIKSHRTEIENTIAVTKCIQSGLLLTERFYHLLTQLLSEHKKIDDKWEQLKIGGKDPKFEEIKSLFLEELKVRKYGDIADTPENKATRENMIDDVLGYVENQYKLTDKRKLLEEIISLTANLELLVSDFEVKENFSAGQLDILTNLRFFYCKDCYNVVSRKYFRPSTCTCGKKIASMSEDCIEKTIVKLGERLVKFIEQNMWFEYGVEDLLQKMKYKTACGCDVIGSSGIAHEVDVIAEKKGTRIMVECKNQELTINHVLIFQGKMVDIGVVWGYMFTISNNVSEDVRKLARSRNIFIVDNILLKRETDMKFKVKQLERILTKK